MAVDPFDEIVEHPSPKEHRRHVTRVTRIATATNPNAADHERIGGPYLRAYWSSNDEEIALKRELAVTRRKVNASGGDPSSILCILHFVMQQPDQIRVQSSAMLSYFRANPPFDQYIWTTKLIGDLIGELQGFDDLRNTSSERRMFTDGRNNRGRWFMVTSHKTGNHWIRRLAAVAYVAAQIRNQREDTGRSTLIYIEEGRSRTAKTVFRWLQDIAEQSILRADFDWQEAVAKGFERPPNTLSASR